MDITGFDMFVIGVLLISGIIAFARGFIREVLSILAFIAAALAALWGAPPLWGAAEGMIQPDWLAKLVISVGVFLAVYVGVTMLTGSVKSLVHRSDQVGFIDRVLGLLFGLARGLFIAALALFIANVIWPQDEQPAWLTQARTYGLVSNAAELIKAIAPASSRIAARSLPDLGDT